MTEAGLVECLVQLDAEDVHLLDAHAENDRSLGRPPATDPAMATRLTVTFAATPDGAQLDLTHDRLDGLRDRYPDIAEQVVPGWESALDTLVAVGC